MKQKKIFVLILLLVLFLPFYGKAESCNVSDIQLESIEVNNTTGYAEEITEASLEGKTINLDLRLHNPGDVIEYSLLVKNTSKDDFIFDEESLTRNTDYLEYEFIYEDNSNRIGAGEEKVIQLRVEYQNKVPTELLTNDTYSDTNVISARLVNIENPNTGESIIRYLLIALIPGGVLLLTNKVKKNKKYIILLGMAIVIPIQVYATCKCDLKVEAKIEINSKEAKFDTGGNVNIKMKELAGTDTSTESFNTLDNTIKAIVYSTEEPQDSNKMEINTVSTIDSPYPIYMWFEEDTIYWWSEDNTPLLNEDASYMFNGLKELKNISGLEFMDSSKTENLLRTFMYTKIKNVNALSKWNTGNVKTLMATFNMATSLTNISGLENWNTSNVENMSGLFQGSRDDPMKISDLTPLRNWNTSKVTNMSRLFSNNSALRRLNGLENWDISHVTSLGAAFDYALVLENIDAISHWNTSNVTNMGSMFQHAYSLKVIDVGNWDTSSLQFTSYMFGAGIGSMVSQLTEIKGIEKWDTSNVTNMAYMFNHQVSLEELDLSGWDTSNVEDMSGMFLNMNVKTIYVSDKFVVGEETGSARMFDKSTTMAGVNLESLLVGGNGTVWSADHIDKEYARIDTEGNPGYCTRRNN